MGLAQVLSLWSNKTVPVSCDATDCSREMEGAASRTFLGHLPQQLGTVGSDRHQKLVKKGTTLLSHGQFRLKAIQKQHSESQLPGLAVKFSETLIDWCSLDGTKGTENDTFLLTEVTITDPPPSPSPRQRNLSDGRQLLCLSGRREAV